MNCHLRTVDGFTTRRFGGNPLAVVLNADTLDGAQMQAIRMSARPMCLRCANRRHHRRRGLSSKKMQAGSPSGGKKRKRRREEGLFPGGGASDATGVGRLLHHEVDKFEPAPSKGWAGRRTLGDGQSLAAVLSISVGGSEPVISSLSPSVNFESRNS